MEFFELTNKEFLSKLNYYIFYCNAIRKIYEAIEKEFVEKLHSACQAKESLETNNILGSPSLAARIMSSYEKEINYYNKLLSYSYFIDIENEFSSIPKEYYHPKDVEIIRKLLAKYNYSDCKPLSEEEDILIEKILDSKIFIIKNDTINIKSTKIDELHRLSPPDLLDVIKACIHAMDFYNFKIRANAYRLNDQTFKTITRGDKKTLKSYLSSMQNFRFKNSGIQFSEDFYDVIEKYANEYGINSWNKKNYEGDIDNLPF